MKKIFTVLASVLLTVNLWAQSPEKMSYQAVIRDAQSNLLITKQVGMQISILQKSEDGTVVYTETQTPTTNDNGLISIQIGIGTTSDDFSAIDWGVGNYYIKTEIDLTGGINYTISGINQLLSVPYAFHAKTTESITGSTVWQVPVLTNEEIIALIPSEGDLVFNSEDNIYQGYNGSIWQSFSANCWPSPATSNAGSNLISPDGSTTITLSANKPEVGYGIGEWTIENGEGGSFTDLNSPTTTFTGMLNEIYTLHWTISTVCCSSVDSTIVILDQHDFGPELTDVENNIYPTVQIGSQLWMAENLRVTKYADGTPIDNVTDNIEWANLDDNNIDKAYCWYNNDSTTYSQSYGALYTYAAATDSDDSGNSVQGVCPTGWHLPNEDEWTTLIDYIRADGYYETEALKSVSGWKAYSSAENNGIDDYGFSALPGGSRYHDGRCTSAGTWATWWSSDRYISTKAFHFIITISTDRLVSSQHYKSHGHSVRCVKD